MRASWAHPLTDTACRRLPLHPCEKCNVCLRAVTYTWYFFSVVCPASTGLNCENVPVVLFKNNRVITEICNLQTQLPPQQRLLGLPGTPAWWSPSWGHPPQLGGGYLVGGAAAPRGPRGLPPLNLPCAAWAGPLAAVGCGLCLCVSEEEFCVHRLRRVNYAKCLRCHSDPSLLVPALGFLFLLCC